MPASPAEAVPTPVTSAAGTSGVFLPGARSLTTADGPPTSAWCLASYGIPCYSPWQVEQAYDLPPLPALAPRGKIRRG